MASSVQQSANQPQSTTQPMLITFLGTGCYKQCIYEWKGMKSAPTAFIAQALCGWFKPKTVYVLLTKKSEQANWAQLQQLLQPYNVIPKSIPDGNKVSDFWEIFQAIVEISEENQGCPFVLDITHGYRSLPLLAFIAITYLRILHNIQLKRLVYGALEAAQDHVVPVFDLTPFLDLLEWTSAADQFLTTGNAIRFARLLEDAQNQRYRPSSSQNQPQNTSKPTHLKKLGKKMKDLSLDLALLRPLNVPDDARYLLAALDSAISEIQQETPPFIPILQKVRKIYEPFANQKDELEIQLNLIKQYVEWQQYVQAVTLAREWVVSMGCRAYGRDWKDKSHREEVEKKLNELVGNSPAPQNQQPSTPLSCNPQKLDEVVEVWSSIRGLRNDVAHCGLGKEGCISDASKVKKNVCNMVEELKSLLI